MKHWHLKREVSYGHIISTILLMLMLITGWVNISDRLTTVETKQNGHLTLAAHPSSDKRLDSLEARVGITEALMMRIDSTLTDIKESMRRIEDRLNKHDSSSRNSS